MPDKALDRSKKNFYIGNELLYSPCFLSIFGRMSKSTAVAYKHLADLILVKRSELYGHIYWIRIKINFALLKSSVNAIRKYRSWQGRAVKLE